MIITEKLPLKVLEDTIGYLILCLRSGFSTFTAKSAQSEKLPKTLELFANSFSPDLLRVYFII